MAIVPFPLTATDEEERTSQIWELIRQLYEEKVGGADLGDVFAIPGDVLTLMLNDQSGLTKVGNKLAIEPTSDGGITVTSAGLLAKINGSGGLESTTSGLAVKCKVGGGIATDGTGTYYDGSDVILSQVDATIVLIINAVETSTTSAGYVRVRAFKVAYGGNYRVKFDLYSAGATAYGQIYKNGVAFGTERSTALGTPGVTYSEDLAFSAGDIIGIYAKTSNIVVGAYVNNFSLYSSLGMVADISP